MNCSGDCPLESHCTSCAGCKHRGLDEDDELFNEFCAKCCKPGTNNPCKWEAK